MMTDETPITIWTAQVVEQDDGELALVFPADLLEKMGWAEGDIIDWQVTDQGIIVKRASTNDIDSAQ